MLLQNRFIVPVPIDQAWNALLDVERIALCLPGAAVDERHGDTFRGRVKIKVGPIQLAYRGEAAIVEQDDAAHRAVIVASGKETRGSGGADARVVAELAEHDGQTRVEVHTELDLSGKPAQFGRSLISEVSGRLLDQFARNLATLLIQPDADDEVRTVISEQPTSTPVAMVEDTEALDAWSLLPRSARLTVIGALPILLLVGIGVRRWRQQ